MTEQFEKFMKEYYNNIIKMLPESTRARQLNEGGLAKELVVEWETKFLREPFDNLLTSIKVEIETIRAKFPDIFECEYEEDDIDDCACGTCKANEELDSIFEKYLVKINAKTKV